MLEVVSSGVEHVEHDYRHKRSEYAARGIQEYWIVDPMEQQVVVLTLVAGLYEETFFRGAEQIHSPMFPNLTMTAEQILQAGILEG